MAHVADHLSVLALEQQYRSCTDVTTARHFQTIWLRAKGHEMAEVAATVSFARRWVEMLWGRRWRRCHHRRWKQRDGASHGTAARRSKPVPHSPGARQHDHCGD